MSFPSEKAVEAALRALEAADPASWAPVIAAACRKHGISGMRSVAAFLSTISHESGKFRSLTENLNYSAEALPKVFGTHRITLQQAAMVGRTRTQPADQQALANLIYGGAWGLKNLGNTQPNDGWFFRGRGLIMVTGRANYTRFAKSIGVSVVDLPAILETREGAADSAACWWTANGCNELAEAGDIKAVRKKVNGGTLGLEEVKKGYAVALEALAANSGSLA